VAEGEAFRGERVLISERGGGGGAWEVGKAGDAKRRWGNKGTRRSAVALMHHVALAVLVDSINSFLVALEALFNCKATSFQG
jgi:hypothetical protein